MTNLDPNSYPLLPERGLMPMNNAPKDGSIIEILVGLGHARQYKLFFWGYPKSTAVADGRVFTMRSFEPGWVRCTDEFASADYAACRGWRA